MNCGRNVPWTSQKSFHVAARTSQRSVSHQRRQLYLEVPSRWWRAQCLRLSQLTLSSKSLSDIYQFSSRTLLKGGNIVTEIPRGLQTKPFVFTHSGGFDPTAGTRRIITTRLLQWDSSQSFCRKVSAFFVVVLDHFRCKKSTQEFTIQWSWKYVWTSSEKISRKDSRLPFIAGFLATEAPASSQIVPCWQTSALTSSPVNTLLSNHAVQWMAPPFTDAVPNIESKADQAIQS